MKSTLLTFFLFLLASSFSAAQESGNNWASLNFLIGTWKGEGSGQPGIGEGNFSFKLDLDKNILVRNSHSEYPSANNNSPIVHEDLMIVYRDYSRQHSKAIYFDNEGHVINYSITFPSDNDIVFTSDKIPNAPVFRLTYAKLENDLVNVKFEISRDGGNFMTYVEGKAKREK